MKHALFGCALVMMCAATSAADEPPFDLADPARVEVGKLRYAQTCAGYCHGGGGVGGRAPDFLGRGDIDAARFFSVIRNGRKRGSDIMPRWDAAFTPEQTWELVAYLKHLAAQPKAAP